MSECLCVCVHVCFQVKYLSTGPFESCFLIPPHLLSCAVYVFPIDWFLFCCLTFARLLRK